MRNNVTKELGVFFCLFGVFFPKFFFCNVFQQIRRLKGKMQVFQGKDGILLVLTSFAIILFSQPNGLF